MNGSSNIEGTDEILKFNKIGYRRYTFDWAFGQFASQNDIFENSMKHLIDDVIDGYNATCFAYGATGTGKTYT